MPEFFEGPYTGPLPSEFRTTWTLENPDRHRGAPFQKFVAPVNYEGWCSEVVLAPTSIRQHPHIHTRSWKPHFPKLYAWFISEDMRPYRWGPFLFIKADWAGR